MAGPVISDAARIFYEEHVTHLREEARDRVTGQDVFGRAVANTLAKRSFARFLREDGLLEKPEPGDSLDDKRKVLLCL